MSDGLPPAAILCGGLGTRLRPVVSAVPKALAPVAGRPFLDYLLRYVAGEGVTDVILCTGFGSDQIEKYCGSGDRWELRIRYSCETAPLGTGGALKLAAPQIGSRECFVLNGDSFAAANLARVAADHNRNAASVTMVVTPVPDRQRFGSVRFGEDDAIIAFEEKGKEGPGWINAGVYLIDDRVIDSIPAGVAVSLENEVFPRLLGHGMYAFRTEGVFIDIGTPSSYNDAERILAGVGR